MSIRKATKDDIEDINKLFLILDKYGVKCQPVHCKLGYRTSEYLQEIIDNPYNGSKKLKDKLDGLYYVCEELNN